jgi:uncharacterized protein YdbL (DUF1318 family)
MQHSLRILPFVLTAALLLPLAPDSAHAMTIDEAKAAGYVGERPDGQAGIVKGDAPAAVKALVEQINGERRKGYESIARKRGIPFDAVAAQAGKKLIERTPTGQYIMTAGGQWVKK